MITKKLRPKWRVSGMNDDRIDLAVYVSGLSSVDRHEIRTMFDDWSVSYDDLVKVVAMSMDEDQIEIQKDRISKERAVAVSKIVDTPIPVNKIVPHSKRQKIIFICIVAPVALISLAALLIFL